ncbi:hypothetical protein E4U11_006879 [Claviceps purpurea]|nr:hypothetical protein E4U11_006879 [Claviceps purpurea]
MPDVPHASSTDVSNPIENPVVSQESPPEKLDDKLLPEISLPRGFVSTTGTDKNSLTIYFIHESLKTTFNSDIRVLKEFAAAWSSGELDVDKKIPFSDMQPCHVIVVK